MVKMDLILDMHFYQKNKKGFPLRIEIRAPGEAEICENTTYKECISSTYKDSDKVFYQIPYTYSAKVINSNNEIEIKREFKFALYKFRGNDISDFRPMPFGIPIPY